MAPTLNEFEDILQPRRQEITNYSWALRKLNTISPYKHNQKYTPEQIKVEVLNSPIILRIIDQIAENEHIQREIIVSKIQEILDEIGYNRKLWVIRVLGYVLTKITTRVCRSIFVNRDSIRDLKCQMGNVPVMYLPSHRSYADFILMSYLLFYYDIEIPSIAAGMDFHGMKGMGTMLRNTGAFFMRRSYNSDNLYWDTFREYVHQLVVKGEKGIEFFIEGTRSRSGKSLYPKIGLLNMILKAFFNGEVPDILFVPINISYDRVMEERLFGFELLGVPKPRESTSGFFKSLSILKENFGNVFVNFGKPISAFEFFSDKIDRSVHSLNPIHVQTPTEAERKSSALLAQSIVENQQKLCVLTTFNLLAILLTNNLILREKLLTLDHLVLELRWLKEILTVLGAIVDFNGKPEHVLKSIEVHENLVRINESGNVYLVQDAIVLGNIDKNRLKGFPLSDKTMTKAVPFVMLQLYVNPTLHYFVSAALVVAILRCYSLGLAEDSLFTEYSFLRSLFTKEFVLFPENGAREFQESLTLLQQLKVIEGTEEIKLGSNDKLRFLLTNLLEPFFLTYYVVCLVLKKMNQTQCAEKTILSETQCQIEDYLNEDGNFVHPYTLSLDTISNCLQNLTDMKVLQKIRRNDLNYYVVNPQEIDVISTKLCDFISILPKGLKSQLLPCKL